MLLVLLNPAVEPERRRVSLRPGRLGQLPRTEEVSRRQVTLPLYPGMGEQRVAIVLEGMKRALENQVLSARS